MLSFAGYSMYNFLKFFACLWHRLFYRKIIVHNLENIPENVPIIFSPNHQNAIMDGLAIQCCFHKPIAFLARGDFFSNIFAYRIFSFLKIMPIFRKREGFDNIKKNYRIFEDVHQWLAKNNMVCLFPESSQEGVYYLRPLSKGLARIALETHHKFNKQVYIIPVTIRYSHYWQVSSTLTLYFGKPITTTPFYTIFQNNNPIAINNLMNVVSQNMQTDIAYKPNKWYSLIQKIAPVVAAYTIINKHKKYIFHHQFSIEKLVVERLNENFNNVYSFFNNFIKTDSVHPNFFNIHYALTLKKFNFYSTVRHLFICLLLFPFYLSANVLFAIPQLISFIICNQVEDKQFYSSIHFVFTFFSFPVWTALITIVFYIFIHNIILSFLLFLWISLLGYFIRPMHRIYKDFMHTIWLMIHAKQKKKFISLVKDIYQILNFDYK